MTEKREIKPFRGMTAAEEAEYHQDNAERYADHMDNAEPIQLDRVVSTRFASAELEQVKAAAKAAGISVSELIRRATVAYLDDKANREPSVPASAVIELLSDHGVTISKIEAPPKLHPRKRAAEIRRLARKEHAALRER